MSTPPATTDDRTPARSPLWPLLWLIGAPLVVAVLVIGTVALVTSTDLDGGASGTASPLDLETVPASIAEHYRSAAAHPEVYRAIPCYCGCEDYLAHRHLYDCFVRADGEGWEAHAAGCGVCIAESQVAQPLIADGQAPPVIRDAVVERYGPKTPTTAAN